jgi:ribokinase
MGADSRVVVVGTLNVDHLWQVPVLPGPGQTIVADEVELQFGGKGANQAVAAARQGATVLLVGAVGDDADGQRYRAQLQRAGIAVDRVAVVPGVATGAAHVYIDPRGENQIVVARGANARIDPAGGADLLRADDVVLVQLECAWEAAVAALRGAERAGARALLNASPVESRFPWGQVALHAVIVNEHECDAIFGEGPASLAERSPAELGRILSGRRISHLIITQGAEPTLHLTANGATRVPTHPVQPRDTTGAGDTFAGVLAAALSAGAAWPEALRRANVAAALSTLGLGAQGAMPAGAAVDSVLARARPTA